MKISYMLSHRGRREVFLATGQDADAHQSVNVDGALLDSASRLWAITRPIMSYVPRFDSEQPNPRQFTPWGYDQIVSTAGGVAALCVAHRAVYEVGAAEVLAGIQSLALTLRSGLQDRLGRPCQQGDYPLTTPGWLLADDVGADVRAMMQAITQRDLASRVAAIKATFTAMLNTDTVALDAVPVITADLLAHVEGYALSVWRARVIDSIKERLAEAATKTEQQARARMYERTRWITNYGTPHLKRAIAAGYDVEKLYVNARAAQEFPGYTIDFGDTAVWQERQSPSEAALIEADRIGGRVVWLIGPATQSDKAGNAADDAASAFSPGEAVVVEQFASCYVLVRQV